MSLYLIYRCKLDGYRPVIWYSQPVHHRYQQIRSIVTKRLDEEHATLFTEPRMSANSSGSTEGSWFSDKLKKGTPLSHQPEQRKEILMRRLKAMLDHIQKLGQQLINEGQREIGEIVLKATEIPNMDCVMTDGQQLALILWGFTSDEADQTSFRVAKVLKDEVEEPEKVDEPQPIETPTPSHTRTAPEPVVTAAPAKEVIHKYPPSTPKKSNNRWKWISLLLLILCTGLALWMLLGSLQTVLPPKEGVMEPIDPRKIIQDPDNPLRTRIVSDRLNLYLASQTDLGDFAEVLVEQYPQISITYYNTQYKKIQLKVPTSERVRLQREFRKMQEVKFVLDEQVFQTDKVPNDVAFSQGKKKQPYEMIGVFNAWDITEGNPNVVIAVIDNGFDITHPEIEDNVVSPWNVITHDTNVNTGTKNMRHGTHVAATVAGLADNQLGMAGVAPLCKIMPIQVGDDEGNIPSTAIVDGIFYALNHGANVINMSLGMAFDPDIANKMSDQEQEGIIRQNMLDHARLWDEIFQVAREENVIIVQAAGNSNVLAGLDPQKRSQNVITVAATTSSIGKATFSNYGHKYTTISAPGVDIYSAVPDGKFEYMQGTSMASPMVSAGVALAKCIDPQITLPQVKKLLLQTAVKVNSKKEMPPMIQLDTFLELVVERTTLSSCDILVDSLQKEIERLKMLVGDSTQQLVIPENPEDLSFAAGKWISSDELHNTRTGEQISLLFEIEADGKGKLILVEENGQRCEADITVSLNDDVLEIKQDDATQCEHGGFYAKYIFRCESPDGETAQCSCMQEDNEKERIISFSLLKR
ncbi:S8 family serine peptidase [Limibacter armeniacum]|uniref:S8 family serine peptidase n=1 Tax=Limibacter armeniacum TaxID=466084 RepID=UPI002FE551A9